MAKDLSVSKLSALASGLTGKEAALLVIDYYIREDKEKTDYKEEIRTIASTITYQDQQRRVQYSFYYELWRDCGFYALDLQTTLMNIEIYTWKLEALKQLVLDSCVKYMTGKFIHSLPRLVTQDQFEALYNDCKQNMLDEILPIDAIACAEAFYRLKSEKLIPQDSYYGITDVFEGKKELQSVFEKYIDEIRTQIEEAVTGGILKEAIVKKENGWLHNGKKYKGTRGVTGETWYNYPKKYDIGFNEIIDNKGTLVEFYKGNVAIAVGSTSTYIKKGEEICWAEKCRLDLIKGVSDDLSVKVDKNVISFDEVLAGPLIQKLVPWINECIQTAINHLEVIRRVQKDIFEDKIELGEGITQKVPDIIQMPKDILDGLIKNTVSMVGNFMLTDKPKFKDKDKYEIIADPIPDETFVKDRIKWLIGLAERESGFTYKM